MLKTFALRGRGAHPDLRPTTGLTELFSSLRRIFGKLSYEYELVTLEPGDVVARGEYSIETFAPEHGLAAIGYAIVEEPRPGRFDVEGADAADSGRAQRGALQRGDSVTLPDGRVVTPDLVLGEARPGRKIVLAGDTAPSPRVVEAARGGCPRPRGDVPRGRTRARAGDPPFHRRRRRRGRARGGGRTPCAHARLEPVLRPRGRERGRTIFPDVVVPRDFDVVEVPYAERGAAVAREGGAAPPRNLLVRSRSP